MVCQVITWWIAYVAVRAGSSQNGRVEVIHCKIINYKSCRKLILLGSYSIDCSVLHNKPQPIWYARGVILEAITYCHGQVATPHDHQTCNSFACTQLSKTLLILVVVSILYDVISAPRLSRLYILPSTDCVTHQYIWQPPKWTVSYLIGYMQDC